MTKKALTKQAGWVGVVVLLALSVFSLAPSRAEPVPEYALDKDFQNCMGGENAPKDPQRAEYCNCIRDSMRGWDLDTYGALATEQSKASGAQQVPAKIEELAKACIAKVLK